MKKKSLYALLFGSVLFSCSTNDFVSPQNSATVTQNSPTTLTSKNSSVSRVDAKHWVDAQGKVVSVASSFSPLALYIAEENQMYAIDNSNGYGYALNSDEPWAFAMASTNGYIYVVLDNTFFPTHRALLKVNPTTGSYDDLTPGTFWPNTDIMAAVSGYLYAVDGANLWKINATTGSRTALSSRNWQGAESMAALGSYVYIVDDGLLWKVNTSSGAVSNLGTGEWTGVPALAAYGSYLYAADDGLLWRINVNSGFIETFGTGTWNTTVAMTAVGGYVYAVDAGALWKINTSNASISLLTPSGYSWVGSHIEMAARQ